MSCRTTRLALIVLACAPSPAKSAETPRPNILWITCEDTGPQLGAYGDTYATSPNLDRLAARGAIYLHAWSNAPVCAPARTTIISGLYPPSTGAEHMRSQTRLPAGMKMYPQYLREAGYYCTNNSKEDYNLEKPGQVWDESSNKAHYRKRGANQPFFAIFNLTVTHESQIRKRPHQAIHDPAQVRVPAYHPDTPEVRQDWAQYFDNITVMDGQAGKILRELADDGLADETIVFFYGDHGSGMPRSKRWPYNSGLHVPLIVYVPPKLRDLAPPDYASGGRLDRLVGFVDLAPTVLSLAGVRPPEHLQGRAFMGPHLAPAPKYLHGFRGRMDERYDLVRSTRDQRYVYIRNYLPQRIYGQHVEYMFQTPTTRVWKRLYDAGELQPPQTSFWERKPPEELYDLTQDRDEVRNLASSTEHREVLQRMRQAQREFLFEIRDVGFLPEGEIHARSHDSSPYEMGHDPARYPLDRIWAAADLASSLQPNVTDKLVVGLSDPDSAVRYWAALGLEMRGAPAARDGQAALQAALHDPSPHVRIVAAQVLGQHGDQRQQAAAVKVLLHEASLDHSSVYVAQQALNALGELGPQLRPFHADIKALPTRTRGLPPRTGGYVPRLIEKLLADLE